MLTVVYTSAAAVGILLAVLHLCVWIRDRSQTAFLLASVMSIGAAATAALELTTAHATTPEMYYRAVVLSGYPICAIIVSMVWFVRLRLKTGRLWLAYLICAIWICAILLQTIVPDMFITGSVVLEEHLTTWGESYSVGLIAMPWIKVIFDIPTPLLAIYVADATIQAFRQGARRDALIFGGATFFFIVVAGVHAVLVDEGIVKTPYMISLAFVSIVIALGLGLTDDVVRAASATRGLEMQRRRWRGFLDGIELSAIRADSEGRIAYVNPHFERLTGQPARNLIGRRLLELAPAGSEDERIAVLDQVRQGEFLPRAKGSIATATGAVHQLVWFSVELRDEYGRYDGIVSVGEDITNAVRTRQELTRTRHEIDRVSRAMTLGELAASLAHELSQPIAAILANVQAAEMIRKKDHTGADEIDEILEDVLRDTRRAAAIMGRVRSYMFNKPQAIEWFEIGAAIAEIGKMLAHDAEARNVEIVLNGPTTGLDVRSSRVELQQVLVNLILNALQALDGVGTPNKRVEISWWNVGADVHIVIDDNGPGLTNQTPDDVFRLFSTTKSGGMGIGLAVSKRIVQQYGGRIEVGQSPSGGARFQVTIPMAEEDRLAASS